MIGPANDKSYAFNVIVEQWPLMRFAEVIEVARTLRSSLAVVTPAETIKEVADHEMAEALQDTFNYFAARIREAVRREAEAMKAAPNAG